MTVKANKWIVRMLLLLVLMGMFTVTVFAGSPGVGFSFHYTANHSNFKLYYTITPQNTTYTLHGLCAGTGTSAGVWYP